MIAQERASDQSKTNWSSLKYMDPDEGTLYLTKCELELPAENTCREKGIDRPRGAETVGEQTRTVLTLARASSAQRSAFRTQANERWFASPFKLDFVTCKKVPNNKNYYT